MIQDIFFIVSFLNILFEKCIFSPQARRDIFYDQNSENIRCIIEIIPLAIERILRSKATFIENIDQCIIILPLYLINNRHFIDFHRLFLI